MSNLQQGRGRSNAVMVETMQLGAIGRALQTHYGDLLREPLPPQFEALLARLDQAEARDAAGERRSPSAPERGLDDADWV